MASVRTRGRLKQAVAQGARAAPVRHSLRRHGLKIKACAGNLQHGRTASLLVTLMCPCTGFMPGSVLKI